MQRLLVYLSDNIDTPCGGLGIRYQELRPYLEEAFDLCVVNPSSRAASSEATEAMRVYSIAAEFKPDAMVCTDHMTFNVGAAVARQLGCKFVLDFNLAMFSYNRHFDKPSGRYLDEVNKTLQVERAAILQADHIFTCSNYYRELLFKITKLEDAMVTAIPNGIRAADFGEALPAYEFEGGYAHNLVYIGRMNVQKGISHLVDPAFKLPEGTALHFVGGSKAGGMLDEVDERCAANDNFFRIGWVDGDEKIQILQTADAIVMPSLSEPFGIVGLEAMAAGTLLISSGVEGLGDYSNDKNALLCFSSGRLYAQGTGEAWEAAGGKVPMQVNGTEKTFMRQVTLDEWARVHNCPDLYTKSVASISECCRRAVEEDMTGVVAEAKKTAAAYSWDKPASAMITKLRGLV